MDSGESECQYLRFVSIATTDNDISAKAADSNKSKNDVRKVGHQDTGDGTRGSIPRVVNGDSIASRCIRNSFLVCFLGDSATRSKARIAIFCQAGDFGTNFDVIEGEVLISFKGKDSCNTIGEFDFICTSNDTIRIFDGCSVLRFSRVCRECDSSLKLELLVCIGSLVIGGICVGDSLLDQ